MFHEDDPRQSPQPANLDPFEKADEPTVLISQGPKLYPHEAGTPVLFMTGPLGMPSTRVWHEDPVMLSQPREKRIDPQWDRYFEMAFSRCRLDNVYEAVEMAAFAADKMLAERQKRAK